jgi:hypothetical protein
MREFLEKLAKQPTFDERGEEVFPCDYQDTFDAGVEQGRIELARELLKAMEKARFDEDDIGPPDPPMSPELHAANVRLINSMMVVIPEENILRDYDEEI